MARKIPKRIPSSNPQTSTIPTYDILIIGFGVLGPALAHSLAQSGRKVLVIERDLTPPDRIVGELLQPGGCMALEKLGMADVFRLYDEDEEEEKEGGDAKSGKVESKEEEEGRTLGAIPAEGYVVFWGGKRVQLPYPPESVSMPWSSKPSSNSSPPESSKSKSSSSQNSSHPTPTPSHPPPRRHQEGRSFHHGHFIQAMRHHAVQSNPTNLTLVNATANSLIRCKFTNHVLGVKVTPSKNYYFSSSEKPSTSSSGSPSSDPLHYFATLTIIADGCFSKFRKDLLPSTSLTPVTRSHFIGMVLNNAELPSPKHGHVILPTTTSSSSPSSSSSSSPSSSPSLSNRTPTSKSSTTNIKLGPILVYQLSNPPRHHHETRMLIDLPGLSLPPAKDLPSLLEELVPSQLPEGLVPSFREAIGLARLAVAGGGDRKYRLRVMPNQYLPASSQGSSSWNKESGGGVILCGDAMNMRHPLTGGGMTVAFCDAVVLTELFGGEKTTINNNVDDNGYGDVGKGRKVCDLEDWPEVQKRLEEWYSRRKGVGVCVNTLAMALYDLFSAEDPYLEVLRRGCFAYFELGGKRISDPVSMLSAITPSPPLLVYHFFAVAFYSIWVLFTQPGAGAKDAPMFWEYPGLAFMSVGVIAKACVVILPILFREMF